MGFNSGFKGLRYLHRWGCTVPYNNNRKSFNSEVPSMWITAEIWYCTYLRNYTSSEESTTVSRLIAVFTRASVMHISIYFLCFLELVRGFLPQSWDIRRAEPKFRVFSFITRLVTQKKKSPKETEKGKLQNWNCVQLKRKEKGKIYSHNFFWLVV